MFALDAAEHELTVLRDDGLYRHLRFRRPGTAICGFDLVTWPGYLAIAGDVGDCVFARTADMLDFFLSGPGINPGYWSEKVQASGTALREYDEDLLVAYVSEEFREHADEVGWPLASVRDLWDELAERVLSVRDIEDEARHALRDFRQDQDEDWFLDSWEWQLQAPSFRYLYLCHAVRWGAEFYRSGQRPPMPAAAKRRTTPAAPVTQTVPTVVTVQPSAAFL